MKEIANAESNQILVLETLAPGAYYDGSPFCGNPDKMFSFPLPNDHPEKQNTQQLCQSHDQKPNFQDFDDCCWVCKEGSFGIKDVWKTMIIQCVLSLGAFN